MTALVIVTYNNVECLRGCLASVRMHNTAPLVPIVVDNGSTEFRIGEIVEAVHEAWGAAPHVIEPQDVSGGNIDCRPTVVHSPDNLGYARGNNLGIEAAMAMQAVEYVLIANDDVVFVDDIVAGLQRVLREENGCGAASPVLYRADMSSVDHNCARREEKVGQMISDNFLKYWWRWRGMACSPAQSRRYVLAEVPMENWPRRVAVDLPSGACMMMRLDTLERVGAFDERTFLYYEENILMARLTRLGLHSVVDTTLSAVHAGAATTAQKADAYHIMRESCRSQLLYVKYYTDAGTMLRWLHRLSVGFLLASYRLQRALGIKLP